MINVLNLINTYPINTFIFTKKQKQKDKKGHSAFIYKLIFSPCFGKI
jgi:hypothetical protein